MPYVKERARHIIKIKEKARKNIKEKAQHEIKEKVRKRLDIR